MVPAYSNYGAALAAYIVQRASGKPFEQYAADNIFLPLGMTHTTFVPTSARGNEAAHVQWLWSGLLAR